MSIRVPLSNPESRTLDSRFLGNDGYVKVTPRRICGSSREGGEDEGCERASPRFLAEPRNDMGVGRGVEMRDVSVQVLDSSRSLDDTGMGRGDRPAPARPFDSASASADRNDTGMGRGDRPAPARSFDSASASADLRHGERPLHTPGFMPRRTFGLPPRNDMGVEMRYVKAQVLDSSRSLGMTENWEEGWR